MRPDSLLRLWHYIKYLLTYLQHYIIQTIFSWAYILNMYQQKNICISMYVTIYNSVMREKSSHEYTSTQKSSNVSA